MDILHEEIRTDDGGPSKVFLHSVGDIPPHWHNGLEFLLVLDGELSLHMDGQDVTVSADDLVIINRHDIHSLMGKAGNLALTLQIPYHFLAEHLPDKKFGAPATGSEGAEKAKQLMARFVALRERREPHYGVRSRALLYELVYLLLTCFPVLPERGGVSVTRKHLKRLSAIAQYIEENYQNDISLRDAAHQHGLTPNYFANFFQKYMRKTFFGYLNDVRLAHAYKALMETDLTVTAIALENGFPNVKAFNRIFRAGFGVPPGAFRKAKAQKILPLQP